MRLKRTYKEDSARALRLDLAAGVGAEQVLRRKSGVSLSEPVPSLFTRPVFQEVVAKQIPDLVKDFAADDWVWGEGSVSTGAPTRIEAGVTDFYEEEYITIWDGILNDIAFVPFSNSSQAIEVLGRIGGPSSPLRALLGAVAENTFLIQPLDAKPSATESATAAATEAVKKRLGTAADKLSGLFGSKDGKPTAMPGAQVTAHFQPIQRLMAGEPGKAPIDNILLRIGQVQLQLKSMGPGGSLAGLANPAMREILQSLQQETETLPPVVQGIVSSIDSRATGAVVSAAAGELEKRYRDDVMPECSRLLPGRYPFTPGSAVDLPLADFAALFNYGGVFDKFFQENMDPLVDRSQSPWSWRSGVVQGPRAILDQFERAAEIRDLFFRKGTAALGIKFQLTLAEADALSLRFVLEIDTDAFEYRGTPKSFIPSWPGTTPGTASMTWYDRYGGQPKLSYIGPWAWFRLIDVGQQERESDVRFRLTHQSAGHSSRMIIEALNVHNPFLNRNWQRFNCAF